MSWFTRIRRWILQRYCVHVWRPAATSFPATLARHCPKCDRTEHLAPSMFYAQFGHVGTVEQVKRGKDLWTSETRN